MNVLTKTRKLQEARVVSSISHDRHRSTQVSLRQHSTPALAPSDPSISN